MKQVRVTELAFHDGTRVRPGTVLTVADNFYASWAEDVVEKQRQTRKPREVLRDAPDTAELA